jgi:hypothetical protein
MLSDIMLVVMAVITPIMCFFAFKMGLDAAYLFGKTEKTPVRTPKMRKLRKNKVENKEIEHFNAVLANIEAYDGTSFGQKEIK